MRWDVEVRGLRPQCRHAEVLELFRPYGKLGRIEIIGGTAKFSLFGEGARAEVDLNKTPSSISTGVMSVHARLISTPPTHDDPKRDHRRGREVPYGRGRDAPEETESREGDRGLGRHGSWNQDLHDVGESRRVHESPRRDKRPSPPRHSPPQLHRHDSNTQSRTSPRRQAPGRREDQWRSGGREIERVDRREPARRHRPPVSRSGDLPRDGRREGYLDMLEKGVSRPHPTPPRERSADHGSVPERLSPSHRSPARRSVRDRLGAPTSVMDLVMTNVDPNVGDVAIQRILSECGPITSLARASDVVRVSYATSNAAKRALEKLDGALLGVHHIVLREDPGYYTSTTGSPARKRMRAGSPSRSHSPVHYHVPVNSVTRRPLVRHVSEVDFDTRRPAPMASPEMEARGYNGNARGRRGDEGMIHQGMSPTRNPRSDRRESSRRSPRSRPHVPVRARLGRRVPSDELPPAPIRRPPASSRHTKSPETVRTLTPSPPRERSPERENQGAHDVSYEAVADELDVDYENSSEEEFVPIPAE